MPKTKNKHYIDYIKPLIGFKITQILVEEDMNDPYGEPYLGFILEKGDKSYQIVSLRDPEGNGPGHMEIIEIKKEGKQ